MRRGHVRQDTTLARGAGSTGRPPLSPARRSPSPARRWPSRARGRSRRGPRPAPRPPPPPASPAPRSPQPASAPWLVDRWPSREVSPRAGARARRRVPRTRGRCLWPGRGCPGRRGPGAPPIRPSRSEQVDDERAALVSVDEHRLEQTLVTTTEVLGGDHLAGDAADHEIAGRRREPEVGDDAMEGEAPAAGARLPAPSRRCGRRRAGRRRPGRTDTPRPRVEDTARSRLPRPAQLPGHPDRTPRTGAGTPIARPPPTPRPAVPSRAPSGAAAVPSTASPRTARDEPLTMEGQSARRDRSALPAM